MHILINSIQWDNEGHDEVRLPESVLVLDLSATPEELENVLSITLSEGFGFNHKGFKWEQFGKARDNHGVWGFFPNNLAIIP